MSSLPPLFDLTGKTALVTGCRRGIGLALATALAESGADIIGLSARLEADGGEVGREVRALGRRFTSYTCDVADRAALDATITAIKSAHARRTFWSTTQV
jgi:2-dehydro-3-deoxy-D-gluconate 5-dehydrogenase